MSDITVNSIETKRIINNTDDVQFLVNANINLYVNLVDESVLIHLLKLKNKLLMLSKIIQILRIEK